MTDRVALEQAADLVDAALTDARRRLVKAQRPYAARVRARVIAEALDPMLESIGTYFDEMADRILPSVAKATAFRWTDDDVDWADERERLREVLGAWWVYFGDAAYDVAGDELGVDLAFDVDRPAVRAILDELGERIVDITEVSRRAAARTVELALERSYTLPQLVNGVADDSFAGLEALVRGWGSTPTGRAGTRAALIAVTESATAYNRASLAAYEDSGVAGGVRVFDGADCGWTSHDDDDKANGTVRTFEDAADHPIAHPRCQRAFAAEVS